MSSENASLASGSLATFLRRSFPGTAWLRRCRLRCSSAECQQRGRLWPSLFGSGLLGTSRGVTLDGRWYCSGECLLGPLITQVRGLLAGAGRERPHRHRVPLGLLLVNRGALSQEQLREALQAQSSGGGERLGHLVRRMGIVPAEEVTAALAHQWGCPVFPLDPRVPILGCQDLLPLALLEAARAVPVYVSPDGRSLHLAFGERLDHTTLYAVERMLQCRTVACVAEETAVGKVLEELQRGAAQAESSFDTMRDPREIAWTIRSYAGEYRASHIALARASAYLWVRFACGPGSRDLLFRLRSAADSVPGPYSPKVFPDPADKRKDGVSNAAGPL